MAFLQVNHLKKYFPVTGGIFLRRKGYVYALDDVTFSLEKGETLGIVGESGCGKTTLGRCVMGLYPPTGGSVTVNGRDISKADARTRKRLTLNLQMIFQDPFESLDPRQTIKQILEEKFIVHKRNTKDLSRRIHALLDQVGLPADALTKFPHEFSGGQRQRIGIARAISLEPDLIVCDEPVSALDVSVQSKILNLLLDLQQKMGLAYLFISHDLSVVKHISDRIAVMYMGKIVETAGAQELYNHALHPYTRALLSSIPIPDPENRSHRIVLKGEDPSVANPPPGCRLNTRCPHARDICVEKEPTLIPNNDDSGHLTACHFFH